jgi:hypothetical protein
MVVMRKIVTAAAAAVASLMVLGLSFAQTRSPPGMSYDRCVGLARWDGLEPTSPKGRAFIARCMKYNPNRRCPDEPKARSAYPAWMCP